MMATQMNDAGGRSGIFIISNAVAQSVRVTDDIQAEHHDGMGHRWQYAKETHRTANGQPQDLCREALVFSIRAPISPPRRSGG